jgi:gliding motility-associated-like protein
VTDAMGCTVTQLDFYVPQPMQVQIGTIAIKNEKCFASCDGRIVIDSPDGAAYSIDGGSIYLANNAFSNLCADTYDVFVKDSHGCFNSTTVEVLRPARVDVEFAFGPQPTDIFATEITFNNLSPNATMFTWYIDSLAILHTESPVFTFPPYEPGLYNVCLAAQNDSGCVDSVCHVVVIDDYTYIFLPNSFTPNADGKNDFFRPVVNNVEADDYVFTIFNRWGGVVFKTTDLNNIGWDGNVNNQKAKEDVYVWKITARSAFTAEKKEWIGHVTLLR